jgi:hypothetical protein
LFFAPAARRGYQRGEQRVVQRQAHPTPAISQAQYQPKSVWVYAIPAQLAAISNVPPITTF